MLSYRTAAAALALAAAATLSSPARADLVPLTNVQLTGQGIGSTLTALTLQSPGSSSTEAGGVNFNGSTFGDAKKGAQQSQTFTLADLGITSASQLALVVNLSEPNSETPPSVTANSLTLTVFNATGTASETFSLGSSPLVLQQVASGLGGSGIVFGLTSGEQTELTNFINGNAGTEVFAVSANFSNAEGGQDAIQAIRLASAVPEPATWAMMVMGFASLGFMAYRRKGATFRLV